MRIDADSIGNEHWFLYEFTGFPCVFRARQQGGFMEMADGERNVKWCDGPL